MAEAIARALGGERVRVASVGVRAAGLNPFVVAALGERGIALDSAKHEARTFADLGPEEYDVVIALSPEAQEAAAEWRLGPAEFWDIPDPTLCEGNRETQLDAYRAVRDRLYALIVGRLSLAPA